MTKHMVTALFADREDAETAVLCLRPFALADDDIIVSPAAAACPSEGAAHAERFWALFDLYLGSGAEREAYAEAVRRGHVLVTAFVEEKIRDDVAAVFLRYGAAEREADRLEAERLGGSPAARADATATLPVTRRLSSAGSSDVARAAAGVLATPSPANAYRPLPSEAGDPANSSPTGKIPTYRDGVARGMDRGGGQPSRVAGLVVVGCDGVQVGVIEGIEGGLISLRPLDPDRGGATRAIPITWIQFVDERVTLRLTGADAMSRAETR